MERSEGQVGSSSGIPGQEWMEHLQSSLGAQRVFGTPVERGGTLVIPVASVRGGGGGGGGSGPGPEGRGSSQQGAGAGFGLSAKPAGVFIVREGRVAWRPAVDANRVLLGVQLLVALAFWVGMARNRPRPLLSPRLQRQLLRAAVLRRLLRRR